MPDDPAAGSHMAGCIARARRMHGRFSSWVVSAAGTKDDTMKNATGWFAVPPVASRFFCMLLRLHSIPSPRWGTARGNHAHHVHRHGGRDPRHPRTGEHVVMHVAHAVRPCRSMPPHGDNGPSRAEARNPDAEIITRAASTIKYADNRSAPSCFSRPYAYFSGGRGQKNPPFAQTHSPANTRM